MDNLPSYEELKAHSESLFEKFAEVFGKSKAFEVTEKQQVRKDPIIDLQNRRLYEKFTELGFPIRSFGDLSHIIKLIQTKEEYQKLLEEESELVREEVEKEFADLVKSFPDQDPMLVEVINQQICESFASVSAIAKFLKIKVTPQNIKHAVARVLKVTKELED